MSPEDRTDIERRLAAPFDVREIRFRPGAVSGNRALALPYVNARVIQDRLDEVLGVTGWQDAYEVLPEGSVVCTLRLRLGDEWIAKMDVGSPSEQPDAGDRRKAAFSDALKRAAVKFGIGRYLYRLPQVWADYDQRKKQFVRTPALPASALPAERLAERQGTPALPANGTELQQRLYAYDARLARQGLCQAGELVAHVLHVGQKAGHPDYLSAWSGPAIQLAVDATKGFEAAARARGKASPQPRDGRPAAASPSPTTPTAALERPYDADQDPAEVVAPDQVDYLITEAVTRGWDRPGLERSVRDRYHVPLQGLSVGQYRECLDKLSTWQKGRAS